jgi:NifU-like protein involved in Fe-S cluster formation
MAFPTFPEASLGEKVGFPPHRRTPYIMTWGPETIEAPSSQVESRADMLNDVYNSRILELAGNIPRIGRLPQPDATATAHSKLCGSTVTIDLKMEGDTVTDFAHDVKACALGQASSSIMARHIVGANAQELRQLREDVRRMLKENAPPPATGRWADVALLEPVRDYKARHASTMLTFDAVVSAIDQIAAKRAAPATLPGA